MNDPKRLADHSSAPSQIVLQLCECRQLVDTHISRTTEIEARTVAVSVPAVRDMRQHI
jgi:hypothetical protein